MSVKYSRSRHLEVTPTWWTPWAEGWNDRVTAGISGLMGTCRIMSLHVTPNRVVIRVSHLEDEETWSDLAASMCRIMETAWQDKRK